MASRSEMFGGGQFEREKLHVTTKVQNFFQRYPERVSKANSQKLEGGGIDLERKVDQANMISELFLYRQEEIAEDINNAQTLVFHYNEPPHASFSQDKTGHTPIMALYSYSEEGNQFLLPDLAAIKVAEDFSNDKKTSYRFSDKLLTCNSSIDLLVEERNNGLVVRDDPGVKGVFFPSHISPHEELAKFEERLIERM